MLYWLTLLQALSFNPAKAVPINAIAQSPPALVAVRHRETEALKRTERSPLGSPLERLTPDKRLELARSLGRSLVKDSVEDSEDVLVLAQLGSGTFILGGTAIGIVVIIALLLLGFWAYTRVYQITPNNEAFVRTGGFLAKKNTVILYGGCIVLPGFHELTRVPMREINIDVERTGNLAVRTQDYLRANMRVTFYVCVNHDEQDVKTAAARLSRDGKISPADIKEALEKRADDAIRASAKRKTLAEIDSDKLGFADEVLNLIQQDLKKVGLTLNNIAISEIEESDTYDTNNFFDAQGVRLRTETIQRSIKQKEEVELRTQQERREFQLQTELTIEQRELEARKQELEIEKERESSQLEQQLGIESLRAKRAREIQEAKDKEAANEQRNKILQARAVEEEEIAKSQGVRERQIESEIAIEEQQKKFKVAQALQKREAEMAEIDRQKTIDSNRLKAQVAVAEAEELSELAKQEAAIAIAQKTQERLAADAIRAKAEAAVETASALERAEREQRLSAILAEQEAEKQRIAENNVVEIDVFRRRRQAEIARQAADLEAESIRTLADAERDKALAEAAGIEARIVAENALSDANRNAQLIAEIAPQLIEQLPEIVKSLAPQPGILGDAKIYAFPGGGNDSNGNISQDVTKLMLSTSGLTLIEGLLEEGKLEKLLERLTTLLRSDPGAIARVVESPSTANSEQRTANSEDS
ncbi:Inner membrane protein YqiK [Geitlerinema sp. FC II]|nr:Inner membrane protein YqiK [Geitlerinema sp. FC II]